MTSYQKNFRGLKKKGQEGIPESSQGQREKRETQVLPMLGKPAAKTQRKTEHQPVVFPPLAPKLSDEKSRHLWTAKKMPSGRTLRDSLRMMDEREILDTILEQLQPAPQQTSSVQESAASSIKAVPAQQKSKAVHEKSLLYRQYGLQLRNSRHEHTAQEYLQALLRLPLEEEKDREGISEAVGITSYCHLPQTLAALRDFSRAAIENMSQRNASITVILCYGKIASGAHPKDLLSFIEPIMAELLFQFQNTRKDEAVKKSLMKTTILTTKALKEINGGDVTLPQKADLARCLMGIIEEEPVGSFSVSVLHQAIIAISSLTAFQPPVDGVLRSELVQKTIIKVFSMPSLRLTKVRAGSPRQETQDYYQGTIRVWMNMLTSLLSEAPSLETLQDILVHTNGWIDATKIYERERAVKCTSFLMKYVSEHLEFDISQDFPLLGQLVAMLSLHIADNVKEIGLQSAEALYNLLYILISKMGKDLETRKKNKKGNMVRWVREDFFFPGPTIFSDILNVAKAFGEHLTPSQINDVVLKAINNLTSEDRATSQAASLLLCSFLEECGMDMEDVPMIFREIYNCLPRISDSRTKAQTLTAVVKLASKRLNPVVDSLFDCSMECDEKSAIVWKALAGQLYCSSQLLSPLLRRLQRGDTSSVAATKALRLILSQPEASNVLQNKFPKLLLALVTQIYCVLGASGRGSLPDPSPHLNPLTSAVEALKSLIVCAGYIKEFNILGVQRCWEKLSNPESFLEGICFLARTLFTFSKKDLLRTFRQAESCLESRDLKKNTVGMAFFTELLFHSETGSYFLKQKKILDVLKTWMEQATPLMKLCGIRGLGYMLQHPLAEESLDPFVSLLINCASSPDESIAKDSIKCLQLMFHHLEAEEYSLAGCDLYPQLLKHFDDKDTELQICSINLFGMLLKGIKEEHRNRAEDSVVRSLVPLIIHLTDSQCGENCRIVLNTIVTFLKLEELPFDIFEIGQQDGLDYRYSLICKYLLCRYTERLPEMLTQMMGYLRSWNPAHRKAAAILIG